MIKDWESEQSKALGNKCGSFQKQLDGLGWWKNLKARELQKPQLPCYLANWEQFRSTVKLIFKNPNFQVLCEFGKTYLKLGSTVYDQDSKVPVLNL